MRTSDFFLFATDVSQRPVKFCLQFAQVCRRTEGNRGRGTVLIVSLNGEAGKVKIEAGYDIVFNCGQEVPIVLMLSVHPSRQPDLLTEHRLELSPRIKSRDYLDAFGNVCTRLVAPPGLLKIRNRFVIAADCLMR